MGSSPITSTSAAPLVEVRRAGQVESLHGGCIIAVDGDGRLLASAGDPQLPVFWRSAAKLHQALPLVTAAKSAGLAFTAEQWAVMCSSHHGEAAQVACVASILEQLHLAPTALRCGEQEPLAPAAARELACRRQAPSMLHNMCSGNHAGLLALTSLLGASVETYDQLSHPAQQRALEIVARYAGLSPDEVQIGRDGCGIPAYRTSLHALATAFARLVAPPAGWPTAWTSAAETLRAAITTHPDMLSRAGEFDAECVRAFHGEAICKGGAEAVGAAAFAPSERFPRGLGLAIKILDGTGTRARAVALTEALAQLQVGSVDQRARFDQQVDRVIRNRRQEAVGDLRAVFVLTRHPPS